MSKEQAAEIVVALIGAVGTPLTELAATLRTSLSRIGYDAEEVRASSLFKDVPGLALQMKSEPEFDRIQTSMDVGDAFRSTLRRADAAAVLCAAEIQRRRQPRGGDEIFARKCWTIHSVKKPEELDALRTIYRERLVVVGLSMSRERRLLRLAENLAISAGKRRDDMRVNAEILMQRDESDGLHAFGQNVRDTLPLADFFISATNPNELASPVDRLVDIFFAHPFMTPTRDECGMFHAQAAALRSAALGRQVGAAITTPDGDVLAVGANEVPKAHGGHYWASDPSDARDFARGHDENDIRKRAVLRELIGRLLRRGWGTDDSKGKGTEELLEELLAGSTFDERSLKGTMLMALTEFGRDVHAEMAALTTAARLGVSTKGCTLYSTTFPCHNCAKHIVSAGISKVVYIEPYAKSLTAQFYPDSIDVDGAGDGQRVSVVPFHGVSPRRYLEWFRAGKRKDDIGRAALWSPTTAVPIFANPRFGGVDVQYLQRESNAVSDLAELLIANGMVGSFDDPSSSRGFEHER